jgi:hypothetical protein
LKSLGHGKRFGKKVEFRKTQNSCNSCKSHCNQGGGRLIVERRALSQDVSLLTSNWVNNLICVLYRVEGGVVIIDWSIVVIWLL